MFTILYRDTESGTKLEERPGLMKVIADAQAGLFEEAVAYNMDRWCRSVEIHVVLQRLEREYGVRFSSATQDFGDGPEGELLAGQIATINQYYSRLIGKKVRLKREMRFNLGKWNGGSAPFGYRSEAGDLKHRPDEAPVARQIFEMWMEHPSFASIRNSWSCCRCARTAP